MVDGRPAGMLSNQCSVFLWGGMLSFCHIRISIVLFSKFEYLLIKHLVLCDDDSLPFDPTTSFNNEQNKVFRDSSQKRDDYDTVQIRKHRTLRDSDETIGEQRVESIPSWGVVART